MIKPTLQPQYRRSGGLIRQMMEQGEIMAKPTLEQYGLTQAEIDRVEAQAEQRKRRLNWLMGLAALAGAGLAGLMVWWYGLPNVAGLVVVSIFGLSFILSIYIMSALLLDRLVSFSRKKLGLFSSSASIDSASTPVSIGIDWGKHKVHKRIAAFNDATGLYEDWLRAQAEALARTKREHWTSLSGRQFEIELKKLFEKQEYKASLTPVSGDGGIDIVLKKNGRTTIVQCKAHKRIIGPETIRALHGILVSFKADDAILASTSGFTSGVVAYAQAQGIRLVSLDDIINMVEAHNPLAPTADERQVLN